jgi:hypothetical protein
MSIRVLEGVNNNNNIDEASSRTGKAHFKAKEQNRNRKHVLEL